MYPPPYPPPFVVRPPRPAGIAILTALEIIAGIVDIVVGIVLVLGYFVLSLFAGGGIYAIGLLVLGFIAFVLGIFSFVMAYGLWTGKRWAWVAAIIDAVIGVVLGILGIILAVGLWLAGLTYIALIVLAFFVILLVFSILILIYLNTRNVKAFFGRAVLFPPPPVVPPPMAVPPPYVPMPPQPYPQATPQPYYPPPQPQPWPMAACPNCRNPLVPGASFCDRCGTRVR